MTIEIALFEPDIPQNTGTLIRMSACFDLRIHIIHPTGFNFSEKAFKRSAMDYADKVQLTEHDSFEDFFADHKFRARRLVLMTTKSKHALYDFSFSPNDILMLGRESAGVPDHVAAQCAKTLRLPMHAQMRSLNIAIAGALATGEAIRQTGHIRALT